MKIITETKRLIGGSDFKLIYRHYATLYFVFCVDSSESELGILDLIQVFVETLDKCFENVCELDLIFHFDKVQYILQELCMGGMVLETNMNEIVSRIDEMNKLEKVIVLLLLLLFRLHTSYIISRLFEGRSWNEWRAFKGYVRCQGYKHIKSHAKDQGY